MVLLWSRSKMTSEPVTALSRGRSQKSVEEKPGSIGAIPPTKTALITLRGAPTVPCAPAA